MTSTTELHSITKHVAAKLRTRGYAARAYSDSRGPHDQPESGVVIHVVCTEAWRYPDGRWEIIDRPARLVHATGCWPHTWIWNYQLAVPEPSSTSALAAWVAEHLPPPDHPEYRTYWHFSSPGARPAGAPPQWEQRWREHLFAELRPRERTSAAPACDIHPRHYPRNTIRSIHTNPPGGERK
ncbi:hypothetical protein BN1232_06255 [Mycobacterium lentiflavum]|uniref:Uncharacterized protein n=2 Tax=Mycobacterium simiae complex TaxID=2249310 RepID=A0A0E4H286_MYCLN|nr:MULTISPECIES: hypothetical protein [Mycobacterium simiae complex]ORJ54335.1 hypothetical protein B5M45_27260 [Mycobacterium simiae]ULP45448.1 hypothetical protein MJO58_28200 [Mycobacterium lentiflavum]CQD24548.1 hypothetical protein BN1232_06255 [Mycobacterium lentiflavum]